MALQPTTSQPSRGPLPALFLRFSALMRVRVPSLALWLTAITWLGLALRLIWVAYTDTIPLGGDPHWYFVVGINLAKGFGYVANRNEIFEIPGPGQPTAFWPPGYPFMLGGLFKVFGESITAAKELNAVLGAAAIPLVYGLASALYTRRIGLWAAALFAVFPNAIAWTPLLFPEELFVLLFVGALWLLVATPAAGRRRWLAIAGFGALVALATLTRGQGAVLVPIAAVYWLTRSGWRTAAASTVGALAIACALIAPWTIRNWVELHAFIPISTNSGAALRVGHAPDATGTTYWTRDEIDGFYMWQSLYRPDWEVEGYREYTNRAIAYAFTHPSHELTLSRWKLYHLYRSDSGVIPWVEQMGVTPIEHAGVRHALWGLFDASYYTLLFGTILLLPCWVRRNANGTLLLTIFVLWTLYHIAFLGEPRYHVPLFPIFAVAFAAGVARLAAACHSAFIRWRARPNVELQPDAQSAVLY